MYTTSQFLIPGIGVITSLFRLIMLGETKQRLRPKHTLLQVGQLTSGLIPRVFVAEDIRVI